MVVPSALFVPNFVICVFIHLVARYRFNMVQLISTNNSAITRMRIRQQLYSLTWRPIMTLIPVQLESLRIWILENLLVSLQDAQLLLTARGNAQVGEETTCRNLDQRWQDT